MHSSRGGLAKQQWAAEFSCHVEPQCGHSNTGWVRFTNAYGFVGITKDHLLELIGKPANGTVTATNDCVLIRLEEAAGRAGREDKREIWLTWNIVTILSKQKTAVATVILDGSLHQIWKRLCAHFGVGVKVELSPSEKQVAMNNSHL